MSLIPDIPPLTGAVDPLDQHLVQGDGTSTYRLKVGTKGPGRLAWELWASMVVTMIQMPEFSLNDWPEWYWAPIKDGSRKHNHDKLRELHVKHPDLADAINAALAEKEG